MATNLHFLSLFFDEPEYMALSDAMLANVKPLVVKEPSHLANWASLYFLKLKPTAEVAIVGENAMEYRAALAQKFYPNAIVLGTTTESDLPLLQGREAIGNETTIYICYNKTCQLPVQSLEDAYNQLTMI